MPYLTAASRARSPVYNQLLAAFHVCDCVDKEKVAISGSILVSERSGMWRMQEAHAVLVAT